MARTEWQKFSKYHYLSHDISTSSQCYGLFDDNIIIGFCAVTHFPHPRNSKIKHCHRLVILPDYQGIGLGTKFLEEIAKLYREQGYSFGIITSARNLMQALKRRPEWICNHYGRMCLTSKTGLKKMNKTSSNNRITATFYHV